jgi:hypothetical protein
MEKLRHIDEYAFIHSFDTPWKLKSILEDEYLKSAKSMESEGQYGMEFDSVFLSLVYPENKLPLDPFYDSEIFLLFDAKLYEDFSEVSHFSDDWHWGKFIEDHSYKYQKFTEVDNSLQLNLNYLELIMKDKKKINRTPINGRNELVVKNDISLDKYLIGIVYSKNYPLIEELEKYKEKYPKYKNLWIDKNNIDKYKNYIDIRKIKI